MRAPRSLAGAVGRLAALPFLLVAVACAPEGEAVQEPRGTLFIGVDISGSFQNDGRFDDAISFGAHYIHGHVNGHGGLDQPRALFVGAIGGERPGQAQAFQPIHAFEGKTVDQIEADLRDWFRPDDRLTDFNAFFQRAATLVRRQNLALAPVTLVLLTDGLPDLGRSARAEDGAEPYRAIDLEPLEYLARNVTLRILYPEPTVAVHWERDVPRDRVRLWTVDDIVMRGWREQLVEAAPEPEPVRASVIAGLGGRSGSDAEEGPAAESAASEDAPPAETPAATPAGRTGVAAEPRRAAEQPALWAWIRDNIDYRVRRSVL